ncbi:MAG: efflux RND transporter permease subunit [Gammaproteobacteria bacterium]|nr:efflux RND transporter permease subunit [Gammaproteobacteria bacterium]
MDLARAIIDRPINAWLLAVFCVLGGIWGIHTVGRLEDPAFVLKEALVLTPYPGASAAEVEREITEPLEAAIQALPQLRRVMSTSTPGLSRITVEIQNTYSTRLLPQIWDELRRKVADTQASLPAGAGPSAVEDDYADVYGMFYAVSAPGLSDAEQHDLSRFLQRELVTVPGVAKVVTAGEPDERIYVEIGQERLVELGMPIEQVLAAIDGENRVAESGSLRVGDRRVRLHSPPAFASVAEVAALRLGMPGTTEQIDLDEIAAVYRGRHETPQQIIHFNGEQVFTLAIAALTTANIVDVGAAVDQRLAELAQRIPLGVTLHPIYEQHRVVDAAIGDFLVNLAMAVAIVIGVLCLFMGWRVGFVVGLSLLLTVLGTIFFMRVLGIEMERISLGALIIAMGMLVDNAIVVAEGMLINMQRGLQRREAAAQAVRRAQLPLLGATIIGIMAFAGIGLSPDETGEFLFSLFVVIGVSLLLSWLLAVSVTPLLGYHLFRVPATPEADPYRAPLYRGYRRVLGGTLRMRALTLTALVVITGVCLLGFGAVSQSFFPNANAPLFYLHYTLPEGTDVHATERDALEIEAKVREYPEVLSVATFVGGGATRFMLTYAPNEPNPAYAELIVRVRERGQIHDLAERLRRELTLAFPEAQIRTERVVFGPPVPALIEARFSGPDPRELRRLGEEALARMAANDAVRDLRQDWRQREIVVQPAFDRDQARTVGVDRTALASALQYSTTGVHAATYREQERQIPILLRAPEVERRDPDGFSDRQVWSATTGHFVPVTAVMEGFVTRSEDSRIHRRDRVRTLSVQADPVPGLTAHVARGRILADIEAIELPPGYALTWGGEYEDATEAQISLAWQLPVSFLIMLVISILLFGKLRQPLIIWLTVPMAVCGVVIGLLATGQPFTFMALLGVLSLSGMLMKNAIVLVDEIDAQIAEGKPPYPALKDASVSRLRPVTLTAATTILGMTPLLYDAFFVSMAVTIMAGLAFATVLTLIAVPTLYAVFFRIRA